VSGARLGGLLPFALAVLALNLAGWAGLWSARGAGPALVGAGILAFGLGLRHAFDADHIAAIDNTTRRLLADGRSADGVGLYFSLGHSAVVTGLALAVAAAARAVAPHLGVLAAVGGWLGTAISAAFLYVVAGWNLALLRDGLRGRAGPHAPEGPVARLLGRLWHLVDRPSRMVVVGLLFGLGFDTASEVALLALSAGAARRLPLGAVAVLPLLFSAGMATVDTLDSVGMARAYAWAGAARGRRLRVNAALTGLSAGVALAVATLEAVQLLAQALGGRSGAARALVGLDLAPLGFLVVAALGLTWAAGYAMARRRSVPAGGGRRPPAHG
jgi:high-affinity nickel-transport protein